MGEGTKTFNVQEEVAELKRRIEALERNHNQPQFVSVPGKLSTEQVEAFKKMWEAEITQVICNIPPESKKGDFDPFPGSESALKLGCTCPEQRWWPQQLRFTSDCPVHKLEKVPN